MRDPNLVRVLQRQTAHKVGLIRHEDVTGGAGNLRERVARLTRSGVRYAICDAPSNADLAAHAEICLAWPLMTGGPSTAEHYPALWPPRALARAEERGVGE